MHPYRNLVLVVATISCAGTGAAASVGTGLKNDTRNRDVVLVQARITNLNGVWTSAAGDKFEISADSGKVLMSTIGTLKGKISGNFDGAAFSGAYQTNDGAPDRGVVRFLLTQDGKLEGSWQSYLNGKHGSWALTKQ